MTYKLEPWVEKISSPIIVICPDGEKCRYDNGKYAAMVVQDKFYIVDNISTEDNEIVLQLKESYSQNNQANSFF